MKKIYYAGIAIILVLIVIALILVVRGLQNKKEEIAKGLLPEEVAQDQVKKEEEKPQEEPKEETKKELPKASSKTTSSAKSSLTTSATIQKSTQSQYEYFMKQTQTVTIELPAGTEISKTCLNNKCEVVIY